VNDKVLGTSCILLTQAYGGKLCRFEMLMNDKVPGIFVRSCVG